MVQHIIVFMIVGASAFYMVRNLYRNFKGQQGCGCGCSGCADTAACEDRIGHESPQPEKDKEA
ncbi:MAG: FeoB-associated Cys-rich membrane protein [Desulfobacteraceae bacterium]|nr:FeoB-associated Cys-rich membrane protein [Desulfobacteraceae bacterium]